MLKVGFFFIYTSKNLKSTQKIYYLENYFIKSEQADNSRKKMLENCLCEKNRK
nr:MAG TPA: hypothetical protein [Caudoviricetes sp.]